MLPKTWSVSPKPVNPQGEQPLATRARRPFWLLFWLALPLVLWWSFREIPPQEVWGTLRSLQLGSVLILVSLNAAILLLFSSRWWLILRTQGYARSYLSLVGYRLAGFGITYFTPGPQLGGEPLQVYLLHRRQGVPYTTAVASVTLDKMLELLANFTFLLGGVATIMAAGLFPRPSSLALLLVPLGLLALPIGYLIALWNGRLPFTRMFARFSLAFPRSSWLPKAQAIALSAESQIAQFCKGHPWALVQALFLSFMIWAALVLEFGLALRFLGLRLELPQIIVLLTAARLAFLLPIPAGLGTLEAGQVLATQALGLNPVVGISLSLLIRARDTGLGALGLWWGGVLSR